MSSDKDFLLFSQIKNNDFSAYEIIFNGYYKQLCGFAFTYVKNSVIAEEIAQEIFIYIWEKRNKIEIRTTLQAYLYAAVKNKCINYIKLELPRQRAMTDISEVFLSIDSPKKNDEENDELKKYIQEAIDVLPKKCRQTFLLSRNAGMTYDEISSELGVSKKTVENQISIALKKLKKSLEKVYTYYYKG